VPTLKSVALTIVFYLWSSCVTATLGDERKSDDMPTAKRTAANLASSKDRASSKDIVREWNTKGWPLMQRLCLDCHNQDFQEGELDLTFFQSLEAEDVANSGGQMKRVLEIVRFGAMPPEDSDQPSSEERKLLVELLDQTLFTVSCDLRPRPGKVTARRLNRAEYNRSIRDLFGMDLQPAESFPSDEVGAGFDNNGDVLSLSPLLMEKYFDAAEAVASQVLMDPDDLPSLDQEQASDQILVHGATKTGSFTGRFLATDSFAWADFDVPVEGEYRIGVRGGNSEPEAPKIKAAVWNRDGLLVGVAELGYYGGGGSSQRVEFRVALPKGEQRFYVEPLEEEQELLIGETKSEFFANLDPGIIAAALERRKKPIRPERNFDVSAFPYMVREIEVRGPTKTPRHLLPPSQAKIVRRYAERRSGKWSKVAEAAKESLAPLMRRAFRGHVDDDEVTRYAQLVIDATNRDESYVRGMQIAVTAILVSPRFLFRIETPPADRPDNQVEEDGTVRLTQHQLATRLSYFLWSSLPDEQLLDAADQNKLQDDGRLEAMVRRMIADPKAEALSDQFAAQWLGLRNLQVHEADLERYTNFTPSLRQAMAQETMLLFDSALQANLPVADLLTTEYSFLNEELAKHYEIDGVTGDQFRQVNLGSTPRRGLLSHASVLTLTSGPTRTSPVKRGKWILENIFGTPPPEPPPGVPELAETKTAGENATFREQLELHRENPSCAACHRVMDQLGFGLEQFDAIGRFRMIEGDRPIDASGELPGGRKFNGAKQLNEMLGQTESSAFAKTFTQKVMTFALGRELTPQDRCVVDEIMTKTAASEHAMADVILEVIRSRPFQYYDWNNTDSSIPIEAKKQGTDDE
jgi:hypothetical protein